MEFQGSPTSSIGIEIELHLLDSDTLDLVDGILPLLASQPQHPAIKPEFNQSTVEINSKPCETIRELEADIASILSVLQSRCQALGMSVCGAGTHPFCQHLATVTPLPRYLAQQESGGYLANLMMTCALHIHVGMPSGDEAIATLSALKPYLPILLALSASSPFWQGCDTGYASYRQRILSSMKSYGVPPTFKNWQEFDDLFQSGRKAGMFDIIRDIHWDLRPHPTFGTLEVRVMDSQPTLKEAIALTAFVHSLIVYLQHCHRQGKAEFLLKPCHWWIEKENYFRASHRGLDADYIEDDQGHSRPFRRIIEDILEALAPTADQLNEVEYLNFLERKLEGNSSYIRQRRVFQQTGSPKEVVAALVRELREE
ncbi:MAG TPA: YbdK family carboxylate-amine ligase [Coleofasciculaceae cyanobacterium]